MLHQLRVDTKNLFEDDILDLDGTDSSSNALPKIKGGQISGLMIARLNRIANDYVDRTHSVSSKRLTINYFTPRVEDDLFPDPSLLDPINED